MAKYIIKIITDEKKLSDRALEVSLVESKTKVKRIVADIKRTLKANKDVVALAGPQVGHNARIFCIKFKNNEIKTFINPLITHTDGQHLSRETNPSVIGEYIVPRPDSLVAMYQTENGNIAENKFEGMAAEIFEQMCQLLDGVLISDFGLFVMDGYDDIPDEDKEQIILMYLDWLKVLGVKLDETIENDPLMHDTKKAIEYLTSVAKGETEVVPEVNGELDFSQSTKLRVQQEAEWEKARVEKIKEKIKEIEDRDGASV